MQAIFKEIESAIEGEVYFDQTTCSVYSVDASIFEVKPLGIVIPSTKEDLVQTVKIANRYGIDITVRGAATGITGGCLGKGIIIDTSKYLNKILKVDLEKREVVCEPGVVQDDLNHELAKYGFRLGPDTSTGNRATLGGMVGNNAAGARSLKYGRMVDHVRSVELLLASGELILLGDKSQLAPDRLVRKIQEIKEKYAEEIKKHFPAIPRRVSGYNLDELIKERSLNLARLIVGSEGTLGIVTEMTLDIVLLPKHSGIVVIYFSSVIEAMEKVEPLLSFHPVALELIDSQIIQLGRQSPSLKGKLNWLQGDPAAFIIMELEGESPEDLQNKLTVAAQSLSEYETLLLTDPAQILNVWTLRKAGLGILLSKRSYTRAIAFLEDISLPPQRLAAFMVEFIALLKRHGKEAGIYGHVGSGCMHIRPFMNLNDPNELVKIKAMMLEASDLLLKYGGALSGEHGDGLIRSWLNPKMFGEKIAQAFIELKEAFDPDYRMNPGKIIALPGEPLQNLRFDPSQPPKKLSTFFNFNREGGFDLAVDLCNGNGACRKNEGTMCPSFQATHTEFHSTRARAQVLRDIIHGHLPVQEMTGEGLYDVMDLCLLCKGCKTECPSQVDMAKMKAEFLFQYQEKHGYSWRTYLFARIGQLYQMSAPFARLNNWLLGTRLFKWMMCRLGIATERKLPPLAQQRFSSWFEKHVQTGDLKSDVVLFNDTFTEFVEPNVGKAAVYLLNQLGYRVIVPKWSCCGRPAISKGVLKLAKEQLEKTYSLLAHYAEKNIPIIGLEPSCLLTLRDDGRDLVDEALVQQVEKVCLTLDEFLEREIGQESWNKLKFIDKTQEVKVHGHCHQKSLVGMKPTLKVLNAIPSIKVSEIPSGCCGMAGSFGYESEHYAISMKIGELKLFPTIRESSKDTIIVANGLSCRHQIADGTKRLSLHLAEFVLSQCVMESISPFP